MRPLGSVVLGQKELWAVDHRLADTSIHVARILDSELRVWASHVLDEEALPKSPARADVNISEPDLGKKLSWTLNAEPERTWNNSQPQAANSWHQGTDGERRRGPWGKRPFLASLVSRRWHPRERPELMVSGLAFGHGPWKD